MLNLDQELRFHAALGLHEFVARLLHGAEASQNAALAERLKADGYRLRLTRDLRGAKGYLRERYADDPESKPGSRSCRHLLDSVTEFGAQGLELDAVLLAWGTDFMREAGRWSSARARRYQRPRRVRNAHQLRVNAYRVLLTRGRDATIVFVPPLSEMEETYEYLRESGFLSLEHEHAP